MRSTLCAVTLLGLVSAEPAQGDSGTLLRQNEITVPAILDALDPKYTTLSVKPAERPRASLLVTFETNSARLTPDAERALDAVGAALKNERLADRSFVIEGHADKRGSPESNKRLSDARASTVRTYLTQKHQVAPQRLIAVGKGDTEPLKPDDPAARENRRVTFVTTTE